MNDIVKISISISSTCGKAMKTINEIFMFKICFKLLRNVQLNGI